MWVAVLEVVILYERGSGRMRSSIVMFSTLLTLCVCWGAIMMYCTFGYKLTAFFYKNLNYSFLLLSLTGHYMA